MGRYYHFSKKVSQEQAEEIVKELEELQDVEKTDISEDHCHLLIITKDNEFSEVMTRAVNICSKAADTELQFERFAC